jgi:hypothetical protein
MVEGMARRLWVTVVGAVAAVLVLFGVLLTLPVSHLATIPPNGPGPTAPWTPAPFSERPVALPGFDPLYGYVFGNNCIPSPHGCFSGGLNYSQIPVLSSGPGQPFGIYYVNNASDLVEYEIGPGLVRSVAPVTPLYQTWAGYGGMLANEFFLAYGSDEALFFGTLSPTDPWVSIETVNLTTGSVHSLTATGVLPTGPANQQPILIGNDLVAVVTTAGGTGADQPANITGFDLDNGTSWTMASDLPFFEANNIYWIPQTHELINVEAHGATGNRVEQWNESKNRYGEPVFSLATTVAIGSSNVVNFVNGIAYNSSSQRLAFTDGRDGDVLTCILNYTTAGLLTSNNETCYLNSSERVLNGQQYVYTSDWVMAGLVNGTQYLFDPWNGSFVPTNEPFTNLTPSVCDGSCFLGTYAAALSYVIDFHASLARNDPFWTVVLASAP